jgi:hypothetical protein
MPAIKHRFSVGDCYRIREAGVFPPGRRVELSPAAFPAALMDISALLHRPVKGTP